MTTSPTPQLKHKHELAIAKAAHEVEPIFRENYWEYTGQDGPASEARIALMIRMVAQHALQDGNCRSGRFHAIYEDGSLRIALELAEIHDDEDA